MSTNNLTFISLQLTRVNRINSEITEDGKRLFSGEMSIESAHAEEWIILNIEDVDSSLLYRFKCCIFLFFLHQSFVMFSLVLLL